MEAEYKGKILDKGGAVFNVKAYGALGDGTDATAAVQQACGALQTAGGGTLLFPPGTYALFSGGPWPATALATFVGLSGVRVEGYGATLVTTRPTPAPAKPEDPWPFMRLFVFDSCTNVSVVGLRGVGHNTTGSDDVLQNADLVTLFGKCQNVEVQATITGFHAGLVVVAGSTTSTGISNDHALNDELRSRGIRFDLRASHCGYGANFQFSGDDAEGTLVTDGCYRSYVPYGVKNHRVRVESRNHLGADVLLVGWAAGVPRQGVGLENIEVWYTDTATTSQATAGSGAAGVEIAFSNSTPITMRDLRVHYDVLYRGQDSLGAVLRVIRHTDTGALDTSLTPNGHRILGLRLSGRVRGPGAPFDFGYGNSWVEELRSVEFADLDLEGTQTPVLDLRGVRDQVTFRRVDSDTVLAPLVSASVPVIKHGVREGGVLKGTVDALGATYRRVVSVQTGDLSATVRTIFRVRAPGASAFFRLHYFAVADTTVTVPANRVEVAGTRSWSAVLASDTWTEVMPLATDAGERTKGAAATPEVGLYAEPGWLTVATRVPTFASANARAVFVLEVHSLHPVDVQPA